MENIIAEVAERLSGADFDGDTVLVIPTNKKTHITSTDELEGLKGFDAKKEYGTTKDAIGISSKNEKSVIDVELYSDLVAGINSRYDQKVFAECKPDSVRYSSNPIIEGINRRYDARHAVVKPVKQPGITWDEFMAFMILLVACMAVTIGFIWGCGL